MTDTTTAPANTVEGGGDYSRTRLWAGLLGRSWLWFAAGCLLVTLLPLLIGWRPYVVESGSMSPRIDVGDVVIADPQDDPDVYEGRVTVFEDPGREGRVVTHRVVGTDDDGLLITKGDANPTVDSAHVRPDDVRGLGRLLVRFVGMPLLWLHQGQWLWLLILVGSLALAAIAAARDHEDDRPPDERSDADAAQPEPGTTGRPQWVVRLAVGASSGLMLLIPTSGAAFAATSASTQSSWSVPNVNYRNEVVALGPLLYYRLDEASGTSANDETANNYDGTYVGGFTRLADGALVTDTPDRAVTLTNATSCVATPNAAGRPAPGPQVFTEIVWFRADAAYNQGGKLVGFETARTGVSDSGADGQYDRHIYMDGNGQIRFGVWTGSATTVTAPTDYADGAWHMAVATLGPGGMRLYVDGDLQASAPTATAEAFRNPGWFRFGCGNLSGWQGAWTGPNPPTAQVNTVFRGSMDEVAVFLTELTPAQVTTLYFAR